MEMTVANSWLRCKAYLVSDLSPWRSDLMSFLHLSEPQLQILDSRTLIVAFSIHTFSAGIDRRPGPIRIKIGVNTEIWTGEVDVIKRVTEQRLHWQIKTSLSIWWFPLQCLRLNKTRQAVSAFNYTTSAGNNRDNSFRLITQWAQIQYVLTLEKKWSFVVSSATEELLNEWGNRQKNKMDGWMILTISFHSVLFHVYFTFRAVHM